MSYAAGSAGGKSSENWAERQKNIAKNIRAQSGKITVARDGRTYVVSDKVLNALADLVRQQPNRTNIGHIKFKLADWFTIPPHPKQRDTEAHWHKCAADFAKLEPMHVATSITVIDDGKAYIVDACTRTFGWMNGLVDASEIPEEVDVSVYFVKDAAAAADIYDKLDNVKHAKNGNDQLFSACGKHDFTPTTDGFIYRGNGVVDALKTAFKKTEEYGVFSKKIVRGGATPAKPVPGSVKNPSLDDCVKRFKSGLKALDSLQPSYSKFSGVVTTVFLLAYVKYAEVKFGSEWRQDLARLLEFFEKYKKGIGTSKDGKSDALANFAKIAAEPGGGAGARMAKMPRLLGAIERYIENPPNKFYAHDGVVNMAAYFSSRTALNKGNGSRKKKPAT